MCKALVHYGAAWRTVALPTASLEEECYWLTQEVDELLEAVYNVGTEDLVEAIACAFEAGWLDIPFPASRYAQGAVVPARDPAGAIRYLDVGRLPFSDATRAFHARQLAGKPPHTTADIVRDIYWFATDWRSDARVRPPAHPAITG